MAGAGSAFYVQRNGLGGSFVCKNRKERVPRMISMAAYRHEDIPRMTKIWNAVLADGVEFARIEPFSAEAFALFLEKQTAVNCLYADDMLAGFYILHPNDEGRRAHVANASFAMDKAFRGKGLGKQLVAHCLDEAKRLGFRAIQFNAVVADNAPALHIYRSLGFRDIGVVPNGFYRKDGTYCDLIMMYRSLLDS